MPDNQYRQTRSQIADTEKNLCELHGHATHEPLKRGTRCFEQTQRNTRATQLTRMTKDDRDTTRVKEGWRGKGSLKEQAPASTGGLLDRSDAFVTYSDFWALTYRSEMTIPDPLKLLTFLNIPFQVKPGQLGSFSGHGASPSSTALPIRLGLVTRRSSPTIWTCV